MTQSEHERFMRMAIDEAGVAAKEGNAPFGAVLVDQSGNVAALGHNQANTDFDPTSHAELKVIRDYCQEQHVLSLDGYRIYASGQPCPMCTTAIIATRIGELYYAAPANPDRALILTEKLVARAGDGAPLVVRGILEEEAVTLMDRVDPPPGD